MKTVTLKARGGEVMGWHDVFVLQTAISAMCEGKALGKVAVSMGIAGKIYEAMEEAGVGPGNVTADVVVELKNGEAKLLWKQLQVIRPEQLGRDQQGRPATPNMAFLALMLLDLAADLGETVEEPDDDEDE